MGRPKTLVEKLCPSCSTMFLPGTAATKFCSILCKNTGLVKPRHEKVCPVCQTAFATRWGKQVCCSQTCARSLDAKVHGPSNWKGGVNKHASGYLKELRKGHAKADKNGYVMQHRLVMEDKIGRPLEADEYVHHMNGIRDDNRPENLELWSGRKDPFGQRAIDLARDMLTKLSTEERRTLFKDLCPDSYRRTLLEE